MGLDMYAWTVPAEKVENAGEFDVSFEACGIARKEVRELAYWRKMNSPTAKPLERL